MTSPLLLLVTLSLLIPLQVFAAPAGRVTKVKGEASFRAGTASPYQRVAAGQELAEGGWVRTGRDGWIELTLSDQSRFTIANDSELELTRFSAAGQKREGAFNLVQGKLRATVVKLAGKQTDFKVRSGTAVAGVKGTEFLMLSHGPANVFFGNEGTVAVTGHSEEAEALVAGTMTQTTRGYRPAPVVAVETGTPLAQAKDLFEAATGAVPPEEWSASDALANIIARWDLNYGHYLADSGRYQESLQVFQTALDLSTLADIRADARLERGGVYGRFLNHPEAALAEYLLVLEEYPQIPQTETALFNVGQTLWDLGRLELARARFRQYLEQYPAGRYRGSVETLLKALDRP